MLHHLDSVRVSASVCVCVFAKSFVSVGQVKVHQGRNYCGILWQVLLFRLWTANENNCIKGPAFNYATGYDSA